MGESVTLMESRVAKEKGGVVEEKCVVWNEG